MLVLVLVFHVAKVTISEKNSSVLVQGTFICNCLDIGLENKESLSPAASILWSVVCCCWGWVQDSHGLGDEAALLSGGLAVDTSVSLARWQAGWTDCGWGGCRLLVSSGFYKLTPKSVALCRLVSMMFWEALITHCWAFLSCAVHEPCQFVMFPVRMLSVDPVVKLTRIFLWNSAFLSFHTN